VSHPNLGLPPIDRTAGFPAAAERLRAGRADLGRRALEAMVQADPTVRDRIGQTGLAHLLRDTEAWIEAIALCLGAGDPALMGPFAAQIVAPYRRRRISMDDLTRLAEGFRAALPAALGPVEHASASAALDAAIEVFRWHRRLAGDARKRNRILQAIYKGA
jgi:predicted amidohydrolase YtcJ